MLSQWPGREVSHSRPPSGQDLTQGLAPGHPGHGGELEDHNQGDQDLTLEPEAGPRSGQGLARCLCGVDPGPGLLEAGGVTG